MIGVWEVESYILFDDKTKKEKACVPGNAGLEMGGDNFVRRSKAINK